MRDPSVPDDQQPDSVRQVLLLRHGATQWSASGRHTGLTDVPLTQPGEQQAKQLAARLAGRSIALALVSPLQRAQRTATLAGLSDFETDSDLVEWNYGGYEGLTSAEIRRTHAGWVLWRDGVPPTDAGRAGESAIDVGHRADRVIARALAALADGDVVLVAHGHLLRVLAARWLGLAPEAGAYLALDTGSLSALGFEHELRVIRHWNVLP